MSLLTDLTVGVRPFAEIQVARDSLLADLHKVYSGAPSTFYSAYSKAQNALQKLEDMTFSDAEIDVFLPRELRRGKSEQQQSVAASATPLKIGETKPETPK